jgi:hypothetical protein
MQAAPASIRSKPGQPLALFASERPMTLEGCGGGLRPVAGCSCHNPTPTLFARTRTPLPLSPSPLLIPLPRPPPSPHPHLSYRLETSAIFASRAGQGSGAPFAALAFGSPSSPKGANGRRLLFRFYRSSLGVGADVPAPARTVAIRARLFSIQ